MGPRLAMTGWAAATPAPIVQVVADLHDGTRPAGVGVERWGHVGTWRAHRNDPPRQSRNVHHASRGGGADRGTIWQPAPGGAEYARPEHTPVPRTRAECR